ncbi:MAG: hypothetical protein MUO19_06810 [Dehalococcoidales bacterium]|nr:hypothetical protein [Dehalococcoidales bacterium]
MDVLVFLKDLVVATFGQMASLFAGVFVFGLLLHFVSHLTFKSLENAFGSRGMYLVAWLGTPVHELGHALFCLLFLHRIEEIKFFEPDPVTGTLGYVHHTWDKRNLWAVLGNFFIGVGPVLIGCGVLFGLFYWLVPGSTGAWNSISASVGAAGDFTAWESYAAVFGDSSLVLVKALFTFENLGTWQFWVFLYLAVCVASNVRLSPSDAKGALSGLGCIVLPFLALNLIGMLTGFGSDTLLPFTASSLGAVYSVFVLAFIMALVGFVLIYLVSAAWYRLRYRLLLKPF